METERNAGNDQSITEQILNRLDACIYITDLESDEILFINDKMKREFDIKEEVVGHKCWKMLQDGFTERCDFCPKYKFDVNGNNNIVWEEHNTVTEKYYRNTDCMIKWFDGRPAHMQHSVDINDMKQAAQTLQRRFTQQKLMSLIAHRFAGAGDFEKLAQEALEEIGSFMSADLAYILRDIPNEQSFLCTASWSPQDILMKKGTKISYANQMHIYKTVTQLKDEALDHITEIRVSDFLPSSNWGVIGQITVPLFVGNQFWGCLGIASHNHSAWDESASQLAKLLGGVFSVALERRESELKLYNAEQTLRTVMDNVSLSIFWKDTQSQFIGGNRALSEMVGMDIEDIFGKTDFDFFSEESAKEIIAADREIIRTGLPLNEEKQIVFADGRERWMHVNKSLVTDEAGRPASIVGISEDITERKQLEQDIVHEKEAAVRASEAKTEFLSRMSHEIRTPMNAIIGMTDIARSSSETGKIHTCLEKIDTASKHLLGIINDILDMAKIEAHRLEITAHEFAFERMVMDSVAVIAFLVEEKQQAMVVHLDRTLPKQIITDEMRLKQVLANLLSNAVKFTDPSGKIHLNVKLLEWKESCAKILFEVADNGIGMDSAQIAKLFTAFEQGDGSITRRYGGTGLGLAICKQLVEMMGGEIWVESEPKKGSKFSFTICSSVPEGTLPAQDGHRRYRDAQILAVDDSSEIRDYFAYVLEGFPVRCDLASNGIQALDFVSNMHKAGKQYDAIFLDWDMPEMNGVETARKIRDIVGENTIIIMISSFKWDSIEREAKAAGICQFIPKPLFPSALIEAIYNPRSCLDNDLLQAKPASEQLSFKGYRILLSEDVEVNREIVAAILEDTEIEIIFAETGVQAIELFNSNEGRFDLILMDIHMPEMDGHEATRRIRTCCGEAGKTVPIIAMTADAFREDVEKCRESGMSEHIAKPINRSELFSVLSRNLPLKPKFLSAEPSHGDPSEQDFSAVVNVEEGIARVLGNKKLYLKLLGSCRVRDLTDRLTQSVVAGERDAAQHVAHELKGVAANLSLTSLFHIAAETEMCLKNGESVDGLMPTVAKSAEETILAISTLCGQGAEAK